MGAQGDHGCYGYRGNQENWGEYGEYGEYGESSERGAQREYGCRRCEEVSVAKRALAVIDSFTTLS
jgi:hypothetical protein